MQPELPSDDHLFFQRTMFPNPRVDVDREESTGAVKDGIQITH